ncbi:MAG: response regulator transcription factor [Nitrospira sp.]|nr:response regulator transcription factor [Nitrospira sp.]
MLHVLLGDDHALFRRGARDFLLQNFAPILVEEAECGAEMIRLAETMPWDVCVMDITMPATSGIDLLCDLMRIQPTMPVLALTMHPESLYAARMIRAGARGYLNKAASSDQLVAAVNTLLSGKKFITPRVAECLAEAVARESLHAPHELLSNREFQVFLMLASGKALKEIGADLFISTPTVSTYRSRILEKLKIQTNAELVRYAIKNSLID